MRVHRSRPKYPWIWYWLQKSFQTILCNLNFWIPLPRLCFGCCCCCCFLRPFAFVVDCSAYFCHHCKKTDSYTPRYVSCRYKKKRTIPLTCMNLTWTFVDGIHSVENMSMHINLVVVNRTRFKKLRVCWCVFFSSAPAFMMLPGWNQHRKKIATTP